MQAMPMVPMPCRAFTIPGKTYRGTGPISGGAKIARTAGAKHNLLPNYLRIFVARGRQITYEHTTNMLEITPTLTLPLEEIELEAVRSRGAGGKTSTRYRLPFNCALTSAPRRCRTSTRSVCCAAPTAASATKVCSCSKFSSIAARNKIVRKHFRNSCR